MRIKSRLSPYPILDNYGDDYLKSSFTCDFEVVTQFTEVIGKVKFNLCNKEIEALIEKGMAEYLVHIECPSTCYREKISTVEKEVEFKANSTKLAKVIEIRTFIVLKQDVVGYMSEDFHPDYSGQSFNLSAHQIIAIGTAMDFKIKQDDRDLESLPSVLKIVKMSSNKNGSLSVNTDNDDYVLVGLYDEVFELYARLGKSTFKETSFSLVLFPALIIILQRMRENKNDDDFKSRRWFQVINNLLEKNGYKLDDVKIENDTMLKICQAMFADPLSRGFKELDFCSERM